MLLTILRVYQSMARALGVASRSEEAPSDAGAVEDATDPPRVRELLLQPRKYEGAYDRSVFTVDAFATAEECEALVHAAHRLLDSYGVRDAQPARSRLSIVSKVDTVLRLRLLALIEAELPDYAHSIFGQRTGLAELFPEYSPGEPAVNIYTAGGEFAPHTDKQSVSLLVPLSATGAFEGGGTAFWADSHHGGKAGMQSDGGVIESEAFHENDQKHWLPPTLALAPPAGTAIIFGGDVTHAGLPVISGTRHLFVMSFSLVRNRPGAFERQPTPSPPEDTKPEVAEGTEIADGLADFADLFMGHGTLADRARCVGLHGGPSV